LELTNKYRPYYTNSVAEMEFEKPEDLEKALKKIGYSSRAIRAIVKWYV